MIQLTSEPDSEVPRVIRFIETRKNVGRQGLGRGRKVRLFLKGVRLSLLQDKLYLKIVQMVNLYSDHS